MAGSLYNLKLKRKVGRPAKYTPDSLWAKFVDFYDQQKKDPINLVSAAKAGDHFGELVSVPTSRPLTLEGFCIHADLDMSTFHDYERGQVGTPANKAKFPLVCKKIKRFIFEVNFAGAAVGTFNHAIIARYLGLADRVENEHTGKDGGPIQTVVVLPAKDSNG